jgi:hypothetical protein
MVIDDFNIPGVTSIPPEADPKLGVDAHAVLARSISHEPFQSIARRYPQISKGARPVHHPQLPQSTALDIRRDKLDPLAVE